MLKRLWGIRHVRYVYHAYRLTKWVEFWHRTTGALVIHPSDRDYLDDIWYGRR
jgi:hypothetical protein